MTAPIAQSVAQSSTLLCGRYSTCAAHICVEMKGNAVGVRSYGAFPLTPALSLQERGNCRPPYGEGMRNLSSRIQWMPE